MKQKIKVRSLLEEGRFSSLEISDLLRIADPRSVIRVLRKQGVNVSDEWNQTDKGVRFKKYYISK